MRWLWCVGLVGCGSGGLAGAWVGEITNDGTVQPLGCDPGFIDAPIHSGVSLELARLGDGRWVALYDGAAYVGDRDDGVLVLENVETSGALGSSRHGVFVLEERGGRLDGHLRQGPSVNCAHILGVSLEPSRPARTDSPGAWTRWVVDAEDDELVCGGHRPPSGAVELFRDDGLASVDPLNPLQFPASGTWDADRLDLSAESPAGPDLWTVTLDRDVGEGRRTQTAGACSKTWDLEWVRIVTELEP